MEFREVCARVRFFTIIINCIDGWNDVKAEASRRYAELMDRLTPELRRKVYEWNSKRLNNELDNKF